MIGPRPTCVRSRAPATQAQPTRVFRVLSRDERRRDGRLGLSWSSRQFRSRCADFCGLVWRARGVEASFRPHAPYQHLRLCLEVQNVLSLRCIEFWVNQDVRRAGLGQGESFAVAGQQVSAITGDVMTRRRVPPSPSTNLPATRSCPTTDQLTIFATAFRSTSASTLRLFFRSYSPKELIRRETHGRPLPSCSSGGRRNCGS